ncbi:MAG: hypothetical protein M1828_005173 [Chrysothrix sp. TS-e1954]|nr:MAG: hypothetical protein M1828_005173 [Chrysothrix sp. TS-e1954]
MTQRRQSTSGRTGQVVNRKKITKDQVSTKSQDPVEDWQPGYPRLAGLMSSDRNFMQYRRFRYLHTRLLLEQQALLNQLERELDRLDNDSAAIDGRILQDRSRDRVHEMAQPGRRTRTQVFQDIRQALGTYDDLMARSLSLETLQRPSDRDYIDYRGWIERHRPLVTASERFIWKREDLLTLRQDPEPAFFDDLIEKMLMTVDCWLLRVLIGCSQGLYSQDVADSD